MTYILIKKEDIEKFKVLTIEHLESLGFKDGNEFESAYSGDKYKLNFSGRFDFAIDGITLNHNYILDRGKWATKANIREENKKIIEQITELLHKLN